MQYIHISTDEMRAVAEFIRERGRVAISEIAAKSSAFIDLSGAPPADLDLGEPVPAAA